MPNEQKVITRLEQLIQVANEILLSSQKVSGYIGYSKISGKKLDDATTSQWRMSCLQILGKDFGIDSHYYTEFEKNSNALSSLAGYDQVVKCLGILKSAKDNYENGYYSEDTQEQINNSFEINGGIENIKNNCDNEAKRNTRIYLIIIFEFLIFLSSPFFYFFGIKYASIFTLVILIISYVLSALSLKEWTPTKLHERILEMEKARIYKRFGISEK